MQSFAEFSGEKTLPRRGRGDRRVKKSDRDIIIFSILLLILPEKSTKSDFLKKGPA
jgi:hypothetical protein